jgi:Concanavalin A-like lectin/glucanases superfamily
MLTMIPALTHRNAPWTPFQRRTWLANQRRHRREFFLSAASPSLRDSLLAYWTLDEGPGEVRADSSFNGYDLAETSFEPDAADNPPTIAQIAGVVGNAAQFTDTIGWLLYSPVPLEIGTDDFSVACWFNYSSNWYDNQALLYCGSFAFGIRPFDACLRMGVYSSDQNDYSWFTTDANTLWENTWYHCAFVLKAGVATFYVNGVADEVGTFTDTLGSARVNDLRLGLYDSGYPLNGGLDEVGVWQRALSAVEVAQLYNNGDGLPFANF